MENTAKKILVIDACVRREESRTKKLMDRAVQTLKKAHPNWQFEILTLMDLELKYWNTRSLKERDELLAKKQYDAPVFAYGNQFREADGIVVAAPFWDLSIPAVLKVYIENISADGITFKCDESGMHGICKGQWMLFLTTRGGMTSHAALVARGWGKCCIVGCDAMHIDLENKVVTFAGHDKQFHEGDWFSLNGTKGLVYNAQIATMDASENPLFVKFMNISDKFRKLGIRTNADTPEDALKAVSFGAEGIGLFRLEHMFYGKNSETPLAKLRKMILCDTDEERKAALDELEPFIMASVKSTLRIMDGKPVVFRLLDPPLHEFVPRTEEKKAEVAKELGVTVEEIEKRGESLHEVNPMMGHRGVRLHVSFPLIAEVEYRAIFTAAAELQEEGLHPVPEIMIPVTISARELSFQKAICNRVKAEVEGMYSTTINYQFGTMIEIPRAALTGDRMARTAQFFSFGTNDLTQMTFGFSRDDVGTFMGEYLGNKILDADPFKTIDTKGVGKLVEYGIQSGRSKRPDLKCGVCGEHGGDPDSIKFFNKIGIDYVSCSPFRVPIARLAAAQAAIEQSK